MHMHVQIYKCVHVCVFRFTCVYIHACSDSRVCVHMYVYMEDRQLTALAVTPWVVTIFFILNNI